MIRKIFGAFRWAANHPMRIGSKFNAMRSFARAQLGARLVAGNVCVPFPNGTYLLVPPQMKGAIHFIWPGVYDFEEMSFIMHYLRPDDLFIDAGANIGVFTVLASGVTGARTIAFEPAPFAFQFLTRNVWLNNLSSLASARNMALGNQLGKVRFTSDLGTENHIIQGEKNVKSVEVEATTLDEQTKYLEPTVIKIDVEGFEHAVLAGAQNCLAKPSLSALIVERVGNANQFGGDEVILHKNIRNQGFIPCTYDPLKRSLFQIPDESFGNIIYIRDMTSANEKLRHAKPYQFIGRSI
jgi:FkbM family methyltransferase